MSEVEKAVLAGCRAYYPALFKHGLKPLPGDGPGTVRTMAETETKVRAVLAPLARRVEELEGALRFYATAWVRHSEIMVTPMVATVDSGSMGPALHVWGEPSKALLADAGAIARSALSEGSGSSRELAPPDESGDACGATERADG